jgi:biotin operon repressor
VAQTVCIILGAPNRKRLTAIVSDRNRQRKHIERAQVILASAERGPVQQIAAQLGVSRPMVWRWQQRFAEEGVDGLLRDKTRSLASGRSPRRRWRAW